MRSSLQRPAMRIGLILLLVILAAGAGVGIYAQARAFSYTDLLTALRAQGTSVRETGSASTLTFRGAGHGFTVDSAPVAAYEYGAAVAAQLDAARVSPDGSTFRGGFGPFGGTIVTVDWIAPPHHFRRGRVIVTYIGDDASILRLLSSVLGPQFAGGVTPTGAGSGYQTLVGQLRGAGATVETIRDRQATSVVYGTPPAVEAHHLRVNGALVSVYQFGGEQTAASYGSHLSGGDYMDAHAHIAILVDYFAPPHFYRTHDLIVEFVGTDPRILQLLASVLGPPFTEGHP